jgi:hypothetical protein
MWPLGPTPGARLTTPNSARTPHPRYAHTRMATHTHSRRRFYFLLPCDPDQAPSAKRQAVGAFRPVPAGTMIETSAPGAVAVAVPQVSPGGGGNALVSPRSLAVPAVQQQQQVALPQQQHALAQQQHALQQAQQAQVAALQQQQAAAAQAAAMQQGAGAGVDARVDA